MNSDEKFVTVQNEAVRYEAEFATKQFVTKKEFATKQFVTVKNSS